MTIYWGAGVGLVGYLIMAWIVGSVLHLENPRFYTLFAILAVLGIGAAAAFLWFWKKTHGRAAGDGSHSAGTLGKDDEIDALVREAENRLAASNLAKGAKLNNLPLVFVIGDAGSTKTSTILHSGLDPELLAGSVYQDTTVVPTRLANIWFARGMIFVEAGGKLLAEPQRWTHLLQRLRPGRLLSAVRGEQAPRAAIMCLDAEIFVRAGAADALTVASRNLQKRLAELSEEFGISFPVYVLFTKMNRLAFFEDFVRNLTAEEARQVLGATVPLQTENAGGVYAEEEGRKLSAAFDAIFYSLADHRVAFLPRENDMQKVPGAYEFPREFRKLRNSLVQFLVNVCRPSQLHVSPFLRGFYFSGVRPIVVQDSPVAAPRASASQHSAFEAAGSATGFFQAGATPVAPAPITPAGAGSRKVPQWLFLSQLFTDVIQRDKAALGASGSSTKTSTLQRILLVAAAVLFLIAAVGFTVSFFGNRALENEVLEAARGIPPGEAGGMNLPTQDALMKLETLRASLAKLTDYEENGAPFGLRWLLYTGEDLYPAVRRLYYERFSQLLFLQTQGKTLASLRMLSIPPAPTDDYAATYDTLKAYLVTTSEYKRSTKWLSRVLVNRWSAGRQVDSILPLATKQFDFYAEDLARGNPFSEKNDNTAVDRARTHLSRFSGIEQIYQFMISDASRRAKKINFNEQFPGSAEVVVNNIDIPGAFTKAGWVVMQENLAKADKFFGGERWVLGDYAAAKPDAAKVEAELRNRYVMDYTTKWREFMSNTKVTRFSGLQDAAKKLNTLSGAQTPLMALFWVATQNTAVGSQKLMEIFDSVQKVVPPPAVTVQYVWPTNQEYMGSLAALQTAISQVADAPANPGAPDPNRGLPIRQSADTARNIVKKMGYGFKIDPESHMEMVTIGLLEAPIEYADALTKGMGAGEINAKARQFCGSFAGITGKFPFNPTAAAEVTLQELNAMFRPQSGRLWAFYGETLQSLMQKQGAQYVANPAGGIQLTPAFVAFFNKAARFSEALYPGGVSEPLLRYSLTPQRTDQIKEMSVTIDGQTNKGTGSKPYTWTGSGTHNVQISAKVAGGSDFEFQDRQGPWALFRFFADADRWSQSGNGYALEWIVRQGREGRPVMVSGKELMYRFVVDTGGAPPVFQKDFLVGMRCVSQAAR